jgi:formylglycine-generating enzyme required for sulfatase activity
MASQSSSHVFESMPLKPSLVGIPSGWFLMGSENGQDNERPVHRVWVDEFLFAACQVTNAEYARFLDGTGAAAPPFWRDPNFNHPQQPVVAVSWFEATNYCEWFAAETRKKYRLPTEAEWERAARGGIDGKLFPWGDAAPDTLPDYTARWKTAPDPVARYAPNVYGLYDISENVHE